MTASSVVITGASTGIGRACTVWLAQRGHRVFAGVRKLPDGEALVRDGGSNVVPITLDVTRDEEVRSAASAIEQALSGAPLGGLVNNAGISVTGPLEALEMRDIRRQFDVNVFGAIAITQALLPLLRRSKGRIINITSVAGFLASPGFGPYSASKHALEAVSDTLRRELRPFGVWACSVEPGAIKTPIWEKGKTDGMERLERFPAEMKAVYQPLIRRLLATREALANRAVPPERVAAAVEHALTSRRPRTRYPVGPDARLASVLTSVLPDRAVDEVMSRM